MAYVAIIKKKNNVVFQINVHFDMLCTSAAFFICEPKSVFMKSFDIIVSPLFAKRDPHIPNDPYDIIAWSAKLSNAISIAKIENV